METYLDQINKSETIKEMKRHLKTFYLFCKNDAITDFVKVNGQVHYANQNAQRSDYINWIFNGIASLDSEDEQEIIKLKYFHGYDELDIAEKFNFHETTVRKKVSSACFNLALALHIEVLDKSTVAMNQKAATC